MTFSLEIIAIRGRMDRGDVNASQRSVARLVRFTPPGMADGPYEAFPTIAKYYAANSSLLPYPAGDCSLFS
jgi:hypothetical protein